MKCAKHPEFDASAFCRECGKPMCAECQRPALWSIYCAEHVPSTAKATVAGGDPFGAPAPPPVPPPPPPPHTSGPMFPNSPYAAPGAGPGATHDYRTGGGPNPGFAFLLGFLVPGVGAIYNGQYAKGLVHAVIFGVIVSILSSTHSSFEPLLGIFLAIWVFYMAFEAYHTARKRRMGIQVDEFSSILEVRSNSGRFPVGAIILIGIGFVLLLDTTGIIRLDELKRFWPAGLILLGFYLLYNRLNPGTVPVRPVPTIPPASTTSNPGAGR